MDKPRLTIKVFDALVAMRDAAAAGKSADEVRNFERANTWLTLMTSWRRAPRRKQARKRTKRR
jgi:hypothetical protein